MIAASTPSAPDDTSANASLTAMTTLTEKKGLRSSLKKLLTRSASCSSYSPTKKRLEARSLSTKTVVTCFGEEDDCTSRISSCEFHQYDENAGPVDGVSAENDNLGKLPQDDYATNDAHVLFLQGRSHSLHKRWDDALKCQQLALSRSKNRVQNVRIEYEIAKIELSKYKEPCEIGYSRAKCRLHQSAVNYYEVELLRKRQSKSLDSSRDVLSILHTLGRLYDEKLNDFENALRCYNEALAMESLLYNDEQEYMLQKTRRKIGALHHKTGNFQLAMITSFQI